MHAVGEVHVGAPGRAEHHRVARGSRRGGRASRGPRPRPAYASTSVSRTATSAVGASSCSSDRARAGQRRDLAPGRPTTVQRRDSAPPWTATPRWSTRGPGGVAPTAARSAAELLAHPDRRGPAERRARAASAPCDREHRAHLGREVRGDRRRGRRRSRSARSMPRGLAGRTQAPGDLVRLAERHALPHQPLGDVGGQREPLGRGRGHRAPRSKRSVATIPAIAGSTRSEGVDRVEDRLLVLLQVPVVRERQALERGQQPGEVADQPAGLAAGQLGDVRVLLLRHDRRAGRVGVVERGPSRTRARSTGTISSPSRDRCTPIIAAANRNSAAKSRSLTASMELATAPSKPELGGHRLRVQRQRRAGQRAGAQRAERAARGPSRAAGRRRGPAPARAWPARGRRTPAARAAGG